MKKPFAKKSFGQNFLVDGNCIDKIIKSLNPQKNELIVEIGSGRGALTEGLVKSGANVIAVELERDMIFSLGEQFSDKINFTLIEADALKVDYRELTNNQKSKIENRKSAKLIANLPYYISTAILQKLIEQRDCFSEMILMFQHEVVERIAAPVGNSERGFLSVLVQTYLETEKLFNVPPSAFRPAPKVNSAVVRLKPRINVEIKDESLFREIVSQAFMQKRKTLFNNFKNLPDKLNERFEKKGGVQKTFERLNIEPQRRAETLTIAEWKALSDFLAV